MDGLLLGTSRGTQLTSKETCCASDAPQKQAPITTVLGTDVAFCKHSGGNSPPDRGGGSEAQRYHTLFATWANASCPAFWMGKVMLG